MLAVWTGCAGFTSAAAGGQEGLEADAIGHGLEDAQAHQRGDQVGVYDLSSSHQESCTLQLPSLHTLPCTMLSMCSFVGAQSDSMKP